MSKLGNANRFINEKNLKLFLANWLFWVKHFSNENGCRFWRSNIPILSKWSIRVYETSDGMRMSVPEKIFSRNIRWKRGQEEWWQKRESDDWWQDWWQSGCSLDDCRPRIPLSWNTMPDQEATERRRSYMAFTGEIRFKPEEEEEEEKVVVDEE